jgi:HAD superfamily hydrolase (TIGR01549 family)
MRVTVRGVIFDMDGTLTVPAIDFGAMRQRLGISEGDILATVKAWPPHRRAAAFAVIEEIEEEARRRLTVQPGAVELVTLLERHGIARAIVTRNTARTVSHLLAVLPASFDPVLTRDFEPVKPDPAPLLHICRAWGLPPAEVLMVGDYRDDLLCGRAAGTLTCLLRNERNAAFAPLADWVVDDLFGLRDRLREVLRGPAPA